MCKTCIVQDEFDAEPHRLDLQPEEHTLYNGLPPDMWAHANGFYGWMDLRAYSPREVRGALMFLLNNMTQDQFKGLVDLSKSGLPKR